MTGSGMGCPDWPKCFGLAIPPTSVDEVTWTQGTEYAPGRMLLANDTLWVAQETVLAEDFQKEQKTTNLLGLNLNSNFHLKKSL